MNAETAKRQATYADLEAIPPHLVAEILDGELVTHPRPAPRHAAASNSLSDELTSPFQKGRGGPGGWIFLDEPELHLGIQVAVPDLAGWRRERLSAFPDTAFIEVAPDWVCEIVSPSTERYDRGAKRRIYGAASVSHYWLLNPVEKVLECYALAGSEWLLKATFVAGETVNAPPFDELSFDIDVLWPLDPPTAPPSDAQPSGA